MGWWISARTRQAASLKTARAAAVLVEYLSASEFEDGTADTWRAGLSGDAQERLALNWPGILAEAQAICADPAACADELASAGVETDFPGMELDGVPDKLTALDASAGRTGAARKMITKKDAGTQFLRACCFFDSGKQMSLK